MSSCSNPNWVPFPPTWSQGPAWRFPSAPFIDVRAVLASLSFKKRNPLFQSKSYMKLIINTGNNDINMNHQPLKLTIIKSACTSEIGLKSAVWGKQVTGPGARTAVSPRCCLGCADQRSPGSPRRWWQVFLGNLPPTTVVFLPQEERRPQASVP